jgi:hypothetical protein
MSNKKMTNARCRGKTAAGQPCGMKPTASGFCFNHDPARAADRARARRRGGETHRTPHAGNPDSIPSDIQTIQDARHILNYVLLELLAADNSIPRNRALLALFDSFVKSLEIGELEDRIAALEQRTK